jgi:hypothetical protein
MASDKNDPRIALIEKHAAKKPFNPRTSVVNLIANGFMVVLERIEALEKKIQKIKIPENFQDKS